MKIAITNFTRVVAVLALTAASTSAFAQSAEYRRGYDAGYAAGVSAARDDRGGNRLRIEEAEYGVRGAMCDARRGVYAELERNRGAVVAHNQLCGDPAPGQEKRLRIVYRCGDGEPTRAFAHEGETLRLACRR
jgi:hypothetical protein